MRAKENKRKHRAAGNTVARIWALAPRPAAQTYTFAPPRGSSRRHRRIRLHRFKGFSRHIRIRLHRFIGARGTDVYASTASREPAPAAYTSTLAPFQGIFEAHTYTLAPRRWPTAAQTYTLAPIHESFAAQTYTLTLFHGSSSAQTYTLAPPRGSLRHRRIRFHRLKGSPGQ